MDYDLDAVAGLDSLASYGLTSAPSGKGKPRTPYKTATVLKKKEKLTSEDQVRERAGGTRQTQGTKQRSSRP
ncbi:hypothetical protein D1007_30250 [Hordeum vulgare]|nr:hypothetical protein D1007_30250 [Hordeum vulgare]